jgi:hypothetical protein
VGNLASAVDELAAQPVEQIGDLGAALVELRGDLDRLEAQWHRRLAAFDRRRDWQSDGAVSAAGWLRDRCRMAGGAAAERVAVARKLDTLPVTAGAFAAGEVGYAQVRLIARAADASRAAAVAAAEATLVDAARRLDPGRLQRVVTHWRHAVDADAVLADANAVHARRRLHVSPTLDGVVVIDGQVDAEAGETVITALEAVDPWTPGDDRSTAQRRADGLVEIARRALDGLDGQAGLSQSGGERPHVTVTVDLATLTRVDGSPAAELERTGPVTGETARRLACDAGVTRVVTGGASQPLDVGRRTRTVPAAIRRALVVRDRGCAHPGCDRPPGWTDAHHRVHWADGGPTALDNLVLLCRRHHRAVHEGGADPPPNPLATLQPSLPG